MKHKNYFKKTSSIVVTDTPNVLIPSEPTANSNSRNNLGKLQICIEKVLLPKNKMEILAKKNWKNG